MNPINNFLGSGQSHYMTVGTISIYNLMINFTSFLFEIAILVMKMLNIGNLSWWWVIAPPILIGVFNAAVEEGVVAYKTRELSTGEEDE